MRNPFRRTRYLHAIVAGNGNAFLAFRQILVLIGYSGNLIKAKMQPKQKVTARLLSVHDGMANFMKLGCRTLSLSLSLSSRHLPLLAVFIGYKVYRMLHYKGFYAHGAHMPLSLARMRQHYVVSLVFSALPGLFSVLYFSNKRDGKIISSLFLIFSFFLSSAVFRFTQV